MARIQGSKDSDNKNEDENGKEIEMTEKEGGKIDNENDVTVADDGTETETTELTELQTIFLAQQYAVGNIFYPLLKLPHDARLTVKDITGELEKRKLAVIMPDDTDDKKLWLLHNLFEYKGKFYAFRSTDGFYQEGVVPIDPADFTKSMAAMSNLNMFKND